MPAKRGGILAWAWCPHHAPWGPGEPAGATVDACVARGHAGVNRRRAATAAARRGLAPPVAPRERPSGHGEGRSPSDTIPDAPVGSIARGDRRAHRAARHPVMLELRVEPPAGSPVRRTPLRGQSHDAPAFGQVVRAPSDPWDTTARPTAVGAERARSSAENRQPLAHPQLTWRTRVPAPLSAAPSGLAQVESQARMPLTQGNRRRVLTSRAGGMAPHGVRLDSAPRPPRAPHPVATPRLTPRAPAVNAGQTLWAPVLARHAATRPALAACAPGVPAGGRPPGRSGRQRPRRIGFTGQGATTLRLEHWRAVGRWLWHSELRA